MEWSRERDRALNVTGGRLLGGGRDPRLASGADVMQVTRVLARSSLPAGYLVMVDGERLE
jgi:hypothetical protein